MSILALRPRQWGIVFALAGLVVDQAHKVWMLGPFAIAEKGRVSVLPFLDLVMVWNQGVSYGLFQQGSDAGRWLLVVIGLLGAVLFAWWLSKAENALAAISTGLIIGGALGNVVDRIRFGAVADFFLFHVGSFEWYVFNLADVWIVMGVTGLVLDWLINRPQNATES